jgi:very-short-patch-repair endonuclease
MGWGLVSDMASRQLGLVTRAQCLKAGLSRTAISRRLNNGGLVRVHAGVYRLPGAPVTWRQSLLAAIYWAGDVAAASGKAAAIVHRFPGILDAPVEISGRKRMRAPVGIAYHEVKTMHPSDVCELDGIRTTTPARTVVDLAGVIKGALLGRIIDDLLRRRLISLDGLAATVERAGRTAKGRRSLIDAVRAREGKGGPPHSEVERRLYRLIINAGLPVPVRQFRIRIGSRHAYPDCAYPHFKIAIEADGYEWHEGRKSSWDHDRERDRLLKQQGWKVLRFSWEEIYFHRDYVVAEIRKAMEERGAIGA